MDDLTNDATYFCEQCEETIKCYTTSGETKFCPVCGSRKIETIDED